MKIVIDNHIPFIKGIFEPVAHVAYAAGGDVDAAMVHDADAIIVRTRTRCDAELLSGSAVKIVCTATIGTDHIDLDYCRDSGIEVVSAPGCNAPAVAQWVLATVSRWLTKQGLHAGDLTLGVVGVGHVGSIVARWAADAGFGVMRNDPPRAMREGERGFCSLNEIAEACDIITFHTPLTREGDFPTYHLADAAFLARASRCGLLLNAARGGIVDEAALAAWKGDVAVDCWEGEPQLNRDLLERCFVATPHIAGYSLEGKQRATATAVQAVARRLGLEVELPLAVPAYGGAPHCDLAHIAASYDPMADTAALRRDGGLSFEALRNHYNLRHEP